MFTSNPSPMMRSAREVISIRLRRKKKLQPISPPAHLSCILEDIDRLNAIHADLINTDQYTVYFAAHDDIPAVMHEIGRLREISFRAVGEGTQLSIDIDAYDRYYHHLFLWDKKQQTIAGAYRIGLGRRIYERFGLRGFYVASLFVVDEPAHHLFARGIELGRAFVSPDYQQKPLPLYLLWEGIRKVLVKEEGHECVFGCVSISNAFSNRSKSLMISFLRRYYFDAEMSAYVRPRKAFVWRGNVRALQRELDGIDNNIKALDRLVIQQQPDGLHVPILLKKYLKQRARLVAFNVDPRFNNSLDGFMYIAIQDLPPM